MLQRQNLDEESKMNIPGRAVCCPRSGIQVDKNNEIQDDFQKSRTYSLQSPDLKVSKKSKKIIFIILDKVIFRMKLSKTDAR